MAIIDFVEWNPGNAEIYAYKFPETNLSTATQLLVRESQEAFFYTDGQMIGCFGPGRHTLSTQNLPLLRNLFGIPFGGNNPFKAEVWFVNHLSRVIIDWKVNNIITHDIDYNTMIPLRAQGTFSIKIIDVEAFLLDIVGTSKTYTADNFRQMSKGEFNMEIKSAIYNFINRQNVGFKRINSFVGAMSENLYNNLVGYWEKFGITLSSFYVTEILIDTDQPAGREIEKSIISHSQQSISGHSWQQAQMMDIAKGAVSNMGNGQGGMLGAVIASGMLNSMGGAGNAMQPVYNQPSFNNQGNSPSTPQSVGSVQQVFCSNCSKKYPNNVKFCPHCGDPYLPCPVCKADNPDTAKRCVSCGRNLSNENTDSCRNCNSMVPTGSAFCPSCGHPLSDGNCTQCGCQLNGARFCPDCGKRN